MLKVTLKLRALNSRRFRKLNSASDLIGQEVMVTEDNDSVIETEIEGVKLDKDSVTLSLESGDDLELKPEEVDELLSEGEVEANSDEEIPEEVHTPKEFEVTRDVINDEGDVESVVTSTVDAIDEDDAVQKVQLIDSRRDRNSRNYRIRKNNSEVPPTEEPKDPEPPKEMPEVQEFKIVRNCKNGKRKIASVTAPTVEEAIEAVRVKDTTEGIEADGYEELVDKLPEATNVIINSDVEEETEEDKVPEPIEDPDPTEDPKPEEKVEDPNPEKDTERETNSYKGVRAFEERRYGIKI